MKRLLAGCVLVAGLGAGFACGKDGSGPVGPQALAILAGNNQSGAPGDTLPLPLTVVLTGTDSHLFPGATVTWTVTTGQATVTAATSITDAQGRAGTMVALGATLGPVVVTATVTGILPVTFNAAIVGACSSITPYTFGTTVNGALAVTDCRSNGFYLDLFSVAIPAAPAVTFTATASTFDNYLELFNANGRLVAFNDDATPGDTGTASFKLIVVPGTYIVSPTSFDSTVTGTYSLTSATTTATLAACEPVFVTRGISFGETVQATDCVFTSAPNTWFSDQVAIIADSGSVIKIHEAAGFDTYLIFFDVFSNYVAFNDDSALNQTNSYLVDTVPATSLYVIDIGTWDTMVTGAYTFDISASATAANLQALRLVPLPEGTRTDIQSRLTALRAGSNRKLTKPGTR